MKLHAITLIALASLSQFTPTLNEVTVGQDKRFPLGPTLKQLQGSLIRGTVTDQSGAVLAGVQVVLKYPDGREQTTTTDDEGRYRFDRVSPRENYSMTFIVSGYAIIQRPNVTIDKNGIADVSVQFAIPRPTPSPRPTAVPSPRPSPSQKPSPFPSPFASPTPQASPGPPDQDWGAVEQEARKLRDSKIVFNPSLQMQQGRQERVEVRISSQDIGDALSQGLKGEGTPIVEAVKVASIMKVVLTGDTGAFDIVPRQEVSEQTVAGKPYAEWAWDVTPQESGTRSLHLEVTAILNIPQRGEKRFEIPVKDKEIHVQINPWFASKRFVRNNWQWLWTVIVIPAGGLLWGLKRKKVRRAGFR